MNNKAEIRGRSTEDREGGGEKLLVICHWEKKRWKTDDAIGNSFLC